jgi:hypothetical protein
MNPGTLLGGPDYVAAWIRVEPSSMAFESFLVRGAPSGVRAADIGPLWSTGQYPRSRK